MVRPTIWNLCDKTKIIVYNDFMQYLVVRTLSSVKSSVSKETQLFFLNLSTIFVYLNYYMAFLPQDICELLSIKYEYWYVRLY